MARPEQIIRIDPENELKFKGPYNVPVTSYMTLYNPTEKVVVFKIKTTAPKKYCVRPNSGILEPNKTIEIAICLQPLLYDQSDKNKHKFMVQTVVAPDGEFCPDTLWKNISPDKLMDSKLKCVFDMNMLNDNKSSSPNPTAAAAAATTNEQLQQENSEEKINKRIETSSSKSAPKVNDVTNAPSAPPANYTQATDDNELLKAAQTVETQLRQANFELKEEILRLRLLNGGDNTTKYQPGAQPPKLSAMYLAVAIAMALCGIVLGKFIL